jgi:hypothetical protein
LTHALETAQRAVEAESRVVLAGSAIPISVFERPTVPSNAALMATTMLLAAAVERS